MFLESQSQFDAWLDENHFLHDASVTEVSPLPSGESLPDSVTVTFRFQIGGGYAAGDEQTIRTIKLLAHGVRTFNLNIDAWHKGNCAEGINSLNVHGEVGFEIDVPSLFTLSADRFEVISSSDTVELVPQWLCNHEFTVTSSKAPPPTPSEWLGLFVCAKHDVVWRYFSGEERSAANVPTDSYTGWFVQFRDRLSEHDGGLLFDYGSITKDGYSLSLRLEDSDCRELWVAAGIFLASLPDTTIRCGNAILEAHEFESHLNSTLSHGEAGK